MGKVRPENRPAADAATAAESEAPGGRGPGGTRGAGCV